MIDFGLACVIGWPVAHSRSPLIHRFWLKKYGIKGDYRLEVVAPAELGLFLEKMQDVGYLGANITIPHKAHALDSCNEASDLARRLGAVNTLWFEDGRLYGDNTDVGGFLANLDEQTPGWDSNCGRAVVLGAGGAARAILAGLAQRNVDSVVLLNRTEGRAEALAEAAKNWGLSEIVVARLGSDGRNLSGANLVINSTSLGMVGQPRLQLDLSKASPEAVVCDIVYAPLETDLLKTAKGHGLRTCSGLGMLLHQAVPGFEHWFGVRPEVTDELRSVIEADIKRGLS